MHITEADDCHIPGILAIYNQAILQSTAVFAELPVDASDRLAWLTARRTAGYPVLVAASADNDVVGYASFGDWRPFSGNRYTVESSVYIRAGHQGKGFGLALMTRLIEHARALGKHVMIAAITADNQASLHLHHKLGFTTSGTLHQVAAKFDTWLDLQFLQLCLDTHAVSERMPPAQ